MSIDDHEQSQTNLASVRRPKWNRRYHDFSRDKEMIRLIAQLSAIREAITAQEHIIDTILKMPCIHCRHSNVSSLPVGKACPACCVFRTIDREKRMLQALNTNLRIQVGAIFDYAACVGRRQQ